jgi:hypothetical protein
MSENAACLFKSATAIEKFVPEGRGIAPEQKRRDDAINALNKAQQN